MIQFRHHSKVIFVLKISNPSATHLRVADSWFQVITSFTLCLSRVFVIYIKHRVIPQRKRLSKVHNKRNKTCTSTKCTPLFQIKSTYNFKIIYSKKTGSPS